MKILLQCLIFHLCISHLPLYLLQIARQLLVATLHLLHFHIQSADFFVLNRITDNVSVEGLLQLDGSPTTMRFVTGVRVRVGSNLMFGEKMRVLCSHHIFELFAHGCYFLAIGIFESTNIFLVRMNELLHTAFVIGDSTMNVVLDVVIPSLLV